MLISAALWVCFGRMNRYFKGVCVDTRVHGADTRVHGAKVGKWPPLVMTAKSQYSDQFLRTSKGEYCTQSVTLLFWTQLYILDWPIFVYIFTKNVIKKWSSVKRKSNSSVYWPIDTWHWNRQIIANLPILAWATYWSVMNENDRPTEYYNWPIRITFPTEWCNITG